MKANAVSDARQRCRQHRYDSALIADVIMHVSNSIFPKDFGREYGLNKIVNLVDEPTKAGSRGRECQMYCRQ